MAGPTAADLSAKVDELQTALNEEQAQIEALNQEKQTIIDNLTARVAELEAIQADGGTPEERQAILDKMNALLEDTKATIPDNTSGGGGEGETGGGQ